MTFAISMVLMLLAIACVVRGIVKTKVLWVIGAGVLIVLSFFVQLLGMG